MTRVLFLSVILILVGCTGAQLQLPNWAPINASRFPVDITSVAFPAGYAISRTSGVTLPNGSWTVRFPSVTVVATNPEVGRVNVSPLLCSNAGGSDQSCYLSLSHIRGQAPVCNLIIGVLPEQSGSSFAISVVCPDLWTRSG